MSAESKPSKALNIILWIAQITLAAVFIWAACTKLFTPVDKLAAMWPWTAAHPGLVKFTAIIDLLAGLGFVLPMLLRTQPRLTVYAAYGSIALMIAASAFHISRGEASLIGVNIFFAILAAFVAWGRK
ncbi:MAG: DoxX family protein [Sphingobacteriales bacterium]|nr:MAG: DoxX family protein [Sphingobacteriales bacterium]